MPYLMLDFALAYEQGDVGPVLNKKSYGDSNDSSGWRLHYAKCHVESLQIAQCQTYNDKR